MKKILALALVLTILLSFASCKKRNDGKFPTMTYLYNTGDSHKAIAEYVQSALAAHGISLRLENQEWNTFLDTRKNGAYTVARNGWLADYSDPICFLDMWTSDSGNNDIQFGTDAHKDVAAYSVDLTELGIDYVVENGTWAETYDYIINLVKTSTDAELRYALMHIAEDLLMSTGAICPIYYYTNMYCMKGLTNVGYTGMGYFFFWYAQKAA